LGANIRGVGQFDFNPAVEPGVGFYVDDVYYATLTGSILDLLDLERVEVLRGPQGTLSGRNSIGGAVRWFSQRPTGSNTGYVQAVYGSRDRIDLRASADFSLTETVSARLSGVSKNQRGYVERLDFGCANPARGAPQSVDRARNRVRTRPAGGVPAYTPGADCVAVHEGEVSYIAVRGQLPFQPTDTIDINIIGDFTDDDRTTAATVLLDRTYSNGDPASQIWPIPGVTPPNPTPGNPVVRDIQRSEEHT